jgi:hypothetical protein
MNDINKFCNDNLGGVNSFKFIPDTDILAMPTNINNSFLEPVFINNGARWYNCYATQDTIRYTEEKEKSKHGDFFSIKFVAFIPKDTDELSNNLESMNNKNFVIDYIDNNGNRKLIGSKENPLQFKYSLDTGSSMPNRNGYQIEFTAQSIHKMPTYFV